MLSDSWPLIGQFFYELDFGEKDGWPENKLGRNIPSPKILTLKLQGDGKKKEIKE